MFEFIASVTITIMSATSEIPTLHATGIDLVRTGEKIMIVSINTPEPLSTTASLKSIVVERPKVLSVEEQREVNYIGYLN